MKQAH